jgi:hypothetical protein
VTTSDDFAGNLKRKITNKLEKIPTTDRLFLKLLTITVFVKGNNLHRTKLTENK